MPLGGVPLLECVCWDHDRFGKDYMGEFDIALEDIFADGQIRKEVRSSMTRRALDECPVAHPKPYSQHGIP